MPEREGGWERAVPEYLLSTTTRKSRAWQCGISTISSLSFLCLADRPSLKTRTAYYDKKSGEHNRTEHTTTESGDGRSGQSNVVCGFSVYAANKNSVVFHKCLIFARFRLDKQYLSEWGSSHYSSSLLRTELQHYMRCISYIRSLSSPHPCNG